MGNRKRIFAGRILSFPSFRKHRAKSPDDQHKSQNGVVLKAAEGVREVGGTSLVVVVGGETKVHQTERNRELEEIELNDTKQEDEHQQREEGKRTAAESDRIFDKRDRTVHFGEGEVVFAGSDVGGGKESGRWTKDDDRRDQEWDEADEEEMGSDLEDNVEEVEEVVERERLRWHQLHRQQNGGTTAADWELDDAGRATKDDEGQQNLGELQQFQVGDGEEKGGEEQMTDANGQRSLEATERPLENVYLNGSLKEEVENMRLTLGKLEQKLKDSNQERDYYKKHFKGENEIAHNGRGQLTDDFGKELMMANKRKYQLESKIKQLELELREAQQRALHLVESMKSMDKLLWLEKERSATLEREREQLGAEVGELRMHVDTLKKELAELSGGEGVRVAEFGGESQQEVATRLRAEQEQRYNELCNLKNKVEWRLGEVSQQCHDTKWRLGEVEATLAHRDWELDQANNRIKQLETSVAATPSATINDELERLREELTRKVEEKSKVEWKLGEVNQCWNDAKWRLGELEAETAHRSHLLDRAHHQIGELERRLENNLSYEDMRREKEALEDRLNELSKTFDGTKWRKGEVEEQKRKLEWRLDEMTHWWNDAKWRIGELESDLVHKGNANINRRNGVGDEQNMTVNLEQRLKELLRDGTLLIRKQPHLDRHKWKLLTFENALKEEVRLRRCWFDADSEGHKEVFLIGSFVNWECALLCEPFPERPSRRGLWLDLPPGRYEFRFLRDAVACKLVAVLATIIGYVTYSPSDLDRGPLSLMVNDDRTPPRPAHANALSTDYQRVEGNVTPQQTVACKLVAVLATIIGYVTYSPSDLDRGPLSLMVNDDPRRRQRDPPTKELCCWFVCPDVVVESV
uniref:AMPK1_CBM domain-containing protein n=1 Tax=Globodera pallida TaxID=36090 RepID=A0A183BVQ0_GLOPA